MPEDRTMNADTSAGEDIDLRGLIRLASWGAAAAAALMLAVFATRSDTGARRMAAVFGPGSAPQAARLHEPSPAEARTTELEFETRQMATAVRSLSADRDRLLARVTVLERSLDDVVTGSIPRTAARPAAQPQSEAPKAVTASPSETASRSEPKPESKPESKPEPKPESKSDDPAASAVAIGPSVVATISSPLTIPTPSPDTLARVGLSPIPTIDDDNVATRTDFGVDIGKGPTVASLRIAWTAIRRSHSELFEGLHPVIAVRDGTKSGVIELRLVVGPLSNAAAAARLCGRVANAGLSCQPVIFDGQRLALR
jgi:hypothetical protein